MKKALGFILLFLPFISFSQQLSIKGIHPNFYVVHEVSSKDSYESIAKTYNLSSAQLTSYNDLENGPGKIYSRTLKVPLVNQNFQQSLTPGNLLVPVTYSLGPNEKITNVLARFKLSTQILKTLNYASDAQLNSLSNFVVGYLKIKSEAAAFFKTVVKSDVVKTQPEIKNNVETPPTSNSGTIANNGIRIPKRRGENELPVDKPEVKDTVIKIAEPVSTTTTISPSKNNSNKIKVFVDCSNTWCDNTYFRTEITMVDFLLDRVASDVHMLITSQQNGSGGSQFQMIFYGQNNFKNLKDTLRFNLEPNSTDTERRSKMLQYIKLGLIPYLAKTNYAPNLDINMKQDENKVTSTNNTTTKDKWNYWVFRAGANGNLSLDQVYKQGSYSGNVSANRTTDKIKISFSSYASKNIAKYEYETPTGTEKFTVKNSSYEIEHTLVKSIGGHWSVGYEAEYTNSTFSNNNGRAYFSPAIEYAIFPYKEVNNKYFTISYGVDVRHNKYYDTTIYNKTSETLFGHNIVGSLSLNQKWGTINSGLRYSNFFHDWNLNNVGIDFSINVRITGGLSVNGYSFGGLTRDQIYLPKGGATEQEILTRRRQLESGYNFYSGFGLSYRFGSKLNNFVNPRFNAR